MNTTIKQFKVMDNVTLSSVAGGRKMSAGELGKAFAVCTLAGGMIGSVIPFFGTIGGAVLGAQYCTGTWTIIRSL